jgi:hypothetical protein
MILLFTVTSGTPIHIAEQELLPRVTASPGEILDISFSKPYPTLGEPIRVSLIIQGNPSGEQFEETINLTDEFEGFITTAQGITWKSGQIPIDQITMTIGKLPSYTKNIWWYPSITGNHTFQITAGSFPTKTVNISVGFDGETIIFPSFGCPRILPKNTTSELTVLVSEERMITDDPSEITHVELEDITSGSQYSVDVQTWGFRTWVTTGDHTVEDELLRGYDVSSIPCGFYNISVTTEKNTYSWPHALQIIQEEPTTYTFVQLTDTHIGKSYNIVNEKKKLTQAITFVNEQIAPDFVVLTGDLVDWLNHRTQQTFFDSLTEVLLNCQVPVFTLPGNHERYENRLLLLYAPFYNLTLYHHALNPLNDYAFEFGGMNLIFLDSGYDYSRWEIKPVIWNPTPEASGLTNTQMYLLENEWGNTQIHQIICMHHPAVNDHDDRGLFALHDTLPSGNDECIVMNRAAFIEYCKGNNVSLVLSGHTHANKVLTWTGEKSDDLFVWPLFVQTASTTLNGFQNGGQVVTIDHGVVEHYEYVPFS